MSTPEHNPADDVQPTKEEWEQYEHERTNHMSRQDVAHHYAEPDDDPPPGRTIPETPRPNQRYMQAADDGLCCLWSVYDWVPSVCPCVGKVLDEHGAPLADPSCKACNGTGDGGPEPELVAVGLIESDARLLVFGGELVRTASLTVDALGRVPYAVFEAMGDGATVQFRKALRDVTGKRL